LAEREAPREDPLGSGRIPWGPPPLSLPRKSSENLEKVPRIREGERSRRSEILNPINNDYWVLCQNEAMGGTYVLTSREPRRWNESRVMQG